jgi:hypothetical protein
MYKHPTTAVNPLTNSESGVGGADSRKMVVDWKVAADRAVAGLMIALMATIQLVIYFFAPPATMSDMDVVDNKSKVLFLLFLATCTAVFYETLLHRGNPDRKSRLNLQWALICESILCRPQSFCFQYFIFRWSEHDEERAEEETEEGEESPPYLAILVNLL